MHLSNHISTQNELMQMIHNNVHNHWSTQNKGIKQECYPITQDHSEQYNTVLEPWIPILYIALSTGVRSSLNSNYIEQSLGLR